MFVRSSQFCTFPPEGGVVWRMTYWDGELGRGSDGGVRGGGRLVGMCEMEWWKIHTWVGFCLTCRERRTC